MRKLLSSRIDDREAGIALIMVIGVGAVLAALVVAAITFSMGGLNKARGTQDWNGAMAAAFAGIEEYQSRLAADPGYYQFGDPASTFSNPTHASPSPVNLPAASAANPAFGLGVGGTWADVPGSSGESQFRYEVDNRQFYSTGVLRLRSTGRAGGETRTVVADLRQKGFIDYLYFTDYEVVDPTLANPSSTTNCEIHYPGSRPGCSTIYFSGSDDFRGPVHTNDAMHTNGATDFFGKVTTAYRNATTGATFVSSGAAPTFHVGGAPEHVSSIGMPETNAELRKEVRTDLGTEVPNPGCLYTGPTQITFNSDGTMTIISPWTLKTRIGNATDTIGSEPSACGTPGPTGLARTTTVSGVTKYVGTTIPLIPNMVIYVQNVPNGTGNVNRTASTTTPPWTPTVPCVTSGNSIGYPILNEKVPFPSSSYGCRNGDLFVKGTLDGNATLAAENYIYVTGDLTYENRTKTPDGDMLGLIGQNAVWVWNPMNSSAVPLLKTGAAIDLDRSIEAAILSVKHTFTVQNYTLGADDRGRLSIWGAISQRFRGPVGTGSGTINTGYAKDYNYDERFREIAPPKFLSPVTTTYGVNQWVEVSPVMNADGSYR